MTAQTDQRRENRRTIIELALAIYDAKPDDGAKRDMFAAYADHIAFKAKIAEQRQWIEMLEIKVREADENRN